MEDTRREQLGRHLVDGVGKVMVSEWGAPERGGQMLVEDYLLRGYGRRGDVRNTLVDMIANVGHCVTVDGWSLSDAVEKSKFSGEAPMGMPRGLAGAADVLHRLRRFSDRLASGDSGYDFEALVAAARETIEADRGMSPRL